MIYTIPYPPQAWKRPGKNKNKSYDTQCRLKQQMATIVKNQHGSRPLYSTPIILKVMFHMPIHKSHKNPHTLEGQPTPKSPDTSNLIKLLEDALEGVLYKNDCIIYAIYAKRVYSMNPRTEFKLVIDNEKD